MKLSLVVAQGVHAGKVIPVTSADFIIGRDPLCQLRPASPAVSKQHCGLSVRDGKVFVRDCGSTNGTFVNGEQVAAERSVQSGDRLRVGPLEFDLKIELNVPVTKSSAALVRPAAAKGPGAKAVATDTVPVGGTVVMEPPPAIADGRDRSSNTTIVDSPGSGLEDDPDHAAALLLGLDDGTGSTTPTVEGFSGDPTTVMEMPALAGQQAKKEEPKKNTEDSSSAAAELLSKYMRRPRT